VTERELPRGAARRLAIIRHVQEVTGNVALTCRYYGITRQCYYIWFRRYEEFGAEGLRDRSSRPHVSPRTTREEVVGKIVYLRQNYHFGPHKIAMYLERYHEIKVSPSGIWRILKRLDMSRLPASQRYKRHKERWKRYEKPQPGHRVQVDVKFVAPIGGTRRKHYQFTAIDDCTRLRVLRVYDHLNQKTAIQFIDYVFEKLPFRVEVVQTDNGAEFQSAFHWHVLDCGVQHVCTSSQPHPGSTARWSAHIGSTLMSSIASSMAWCSTTPSSSPPSSRSGKTSTISTARTEAWVAKLPTSAYAKRPGPLCNRPTSVAHTERDHVQVHLTLDI
jgi:transposase